MSQEFQTLAALAVVALAAIWLLWRALGRRDAGSCGSGECGAVSRDVRKLRGKLKTR